MRFGIKSPSWSQRGNKSGQMTRMKNMGALSTLPSDFTNGCNSLRKQCYLFFLQKTKPPTATMAKAPKIHPNTAPQMTPEEGPNKKHFSCVQEGRCATSATSRDPHRIQGERACGTHRGEGRIFGQQLSRAGVFTLSPPSAGWS